jgi:hypothetical protein
LRFGTQHGFPPHLGRSPKLEVILLEPPILLQ